MIPCAQHAGKGKTRGRHNRHQWLPGDGEGAENKEAAQRNVGDNGNVLFLDVFVGGYDSMNLSNLRTVL